MLKIHSVASHQRDESWNTSNQSGRFSPLRIASARTLKRLGIGLAGTFAFAGAAAAVHTTLLDQPAKDSANSSVQRPQNSTTEPKQYDTSSPGPAPASDSPGDRSSSSANSSNRTEVVLNIDGTQVAVPGNGSTHKVIKNSDGSTTTVDSSSSNTSSGSTGNSSSSSSFNLQVNTESHSSGDG